MGAHIERPITYCCVSPMTTGGQDQAATGISGSVNFEFIKLRAYRPYSYAGDLTHV
jgi:hypothetical protein